jgi:hypothetical protein
MDRAGWTVLVVSNESRHCFQIGEIVTLSESYEGEGVYWRPKGVNGGWLNRTDYIRVEEEIDYGELL